MNPSLYTYLIDEFSKKPAVTFSGDYTRPQVGERVRIKTGWEDAGKVGIYRGKATYYAEPMAAVQFAGEEYTSAAAFDSIERFPFTHDEQVERAFADYRALERKCGSPDDEHAAFHAVTTALRDGAYASTVDADG